MTALTDLIVRVEQGDDDDINSRIAAAFPEILLARHIYDFENCHSFRVVRGGGVAYKRGADLVWRSVSSGVIPDFTGSLDAAAAFVEAVLPGWGWEVSRHPGQAFACANVWAPVGVFDPGYSHVDSSAPTPALALVLATLRAHAAKETT